MYSIHIYSNLICILYKIIARVCVDIFFIQEREKDGTKPIVLIFNYR